jgi:hypothetical protein
MNASPVEPVFHSLPGTSGVAPVYGQTNDYIDNTSDFRVIMVATLKRTSLKPDPSTVDKSHSKRLPRLWRQIADRFVEDVIDRINNDCSDALAESGYAASEDAQASCRAIATRIAPSMAFAQHIQYDSFLEEEGGISLVLRSKDTGRRVNYRVSADGRKLTIVSVDENARASSDSAKVEDYGTLDRWARWVIRTL